MENLKFINKIKEKIQKYNVYIFYTIVFAIIAIAAFSVFIKTGKTFIWETDGFKQHYVILYDFNTMIRNIFQNGISLFSWNMGLGLDVIGQYSYYILGDPFAYISLLFPIKCLKYLYQILIILRIYCVGIAFIMYCRYNKKEDYNTLIGAIIYTFSGYILYASVRHPYFTNPAIMLPLVFLGIDKILKEDKYTWFTVTIAILAIMNYYFLYMITILAVIYAIVKYITEFKEKGIKEFGLKFGKTALHYIIGIMIAGIILLPTIYAFLNSDRAGVAYTYYDLSYYEQLLFSQHDTLHWSKIYVSVIGILMLPIGILNLKNNKENRTIIINIAISIVILIVPFLGSVMNGFSFQTNRWCFAYTFYMAYLVVINLRKNLKYNRRELLSMIFLFITYMLLSLIANDVNNEFILMSVIFMALIITTLIFRKYSINTRKMCKIVLFLMICGNIIASAWSLYNEYGDDYASEFLSVSMVDEKYDNYEGKIENFSQAIEYIKENDNSFYRIGTPIYRDNNLSLMHDYNGLNTYLSIGNGYISRFSKELLVLGNTKTNALNEFDSRTKLTTLLGCKYYIAPNSKTSYVPYGYKLIKEYETTKVYENENYLDIGIFYDNYILEEDYNELTAIEKEQALLETAVIEDVSKIEGTNIDYNEDLTNTIKDASKVVGVKNLGEDNHIKEKIFYVKFEEVENCELYLYFDNLEYNSIDNYYVKVKYDDIEKSQRVRNKITSPYYVKTPYILFNLGYKDKHSGIIEVELTGIGEYTCDNIKVIAVPMEKYEQSIANLKETPFEIQEVGNDYIKGNINNSKSGILQISTSYSSGWKVYVDGKEAEIINVNTGFIGIPLEAGKHEIYLTYTTPWIKLGIIISILGILILVVIIKQNMRKINN